MATTSSIKKAKAHRSTRALCIPTSDSTDAVSPSAYFQWKGWLDRILAAILLILALPLLGLLAILIRLSSRGTAIFRQVRVGKDAREFTMLKFRSMNTNAEAGDGGRLEPQERSPQHSTGTCAPQAPPRRTTAIVQRGQRRDVAGWAASGAAGVRPRPRRADSRVHQTAWAVLPGITGLAQLNLPPDTDLDSVRRKLVLDIEYVQRADVLLDLRILFCTFLRILRFPALLSLFRLKRTTPDFKQNFHPLSVEGATGKLQATPQNLFKLIADDSRAKGETNAGNGMPKKPVNGREAKRPRPR